MIRIGDRVRTALDLPGLVVGVTEERGYNRILVKLDAKPNSPPISYPPSLVRKEQPVSVQEDQKPSAPPTPVQPVQPSRELAERPEPTETAGSLAELRTLGWWLALAETGADTKEALGAAAALRFYFVRELGLPPLAAAEVSVIKGKLFVQSKLLRALAARAGYRVVRTRDSNDDSCTAVVIDERGVEVGRSTFTMADAKRAGLVRDRSAWVTHPGRMLWARAAKFAIDDYAPEVSLGLMTDDERAEILDQPFIEVDDPSPEITLDGPRTDQVEQYDLEREAVTEEP